jgi:3-hydroxy-9,10-secoandrosta-1,3,5(10)-triene-9,17-dione monooxygenase reductase component
LTVLRTESSRTSACPPSAGSPSGESLPAGPQAAEPSGDAFRRFMGRWPTGVGVIGMLDGGNECGMTANSLVSLSLSPLLVAVSVRLSSRAASLLLPSSGFAVSILAQGQEQLASWFARRERADHGDGEFSNISHGYAPRSGRPYLYDTVGFLDCVVEAQLTAGDHAVVIGRVEYLRALSDRPPLVFYRGGWSGVADA